MLRKSPASSRKSSGSSSSDKKAGDGSASNVLSNTPSKTPTKQLTIIEAVNRQIVKQRPSFRSKVLFNSDNDDSDDNNDLLSQATSVSTGTVKELACEAKTFISKLSLKSRVKRDDNLNHTRSEFDFSVNAKPESKVTLVGDNRLKDASRSQSASGDGNNVNENNIFELSWAHMNSVEAKQSTFTTPRKANRKKSNATPSSETSASKFSSTSTPKRSKSSPFVHEKVISPSVSAAKSLKQTTLFSPSSQKSSPVTVSSLSTSKGVRSVADNKNKKLPLENSDVELLLETPKSFFVPKSRFKNSSPIPGHSAHVLYDSDKSSDSGILSKGSVYCSSSKSPTSFSDISEFSSNLNLALATPRENCLPMQLAKEPAEGKKAEKRSFTSTVSGESSASSKKLKLSLKSHHLQNLLQSKQDKLVELEEPQSTSFPRVLHESYAQKIINFDPDLFETENLSMNELSAVQQPQQRRHRFIKKIPKCFADLRSCFTPLSPSKRVKPKPANYLILPELKKHLELLEKKTDGDKSKSKGAEDESQESQQLAYYWSNFLEIAQSVLDLYDDRRLFNDDEIETIKKYYTLSENAQMLYARLFVRHHKWHPSTTVNYPEISYELRAIFEELITADYIEGEDSLKDLETTLNLLHFAQIKFLCKDQNVKCETTKARCIQAILDNCSKHKPLFSGVGSEKERFDLVLKRAKERLNHCYRVVDKPRNIFRRMMMLYSLSDTYLDSSQNENQPVQLTRLMHVNMGKLVFPEYEMERKAVIFRDRDDLLRYETAFTLENDIWTYMENKKWIEAKSSCDTSWALYQDLMKDTASIQHDSNLPGFLRRYTAGHLLTRCLNYRVEVLQKLKCYGEANTQLEELLSQMLYCQNYRGHWIDRYALNAHQHLKLPLKAIAIIEYGLKDPQITEDHLLSLSARAERLRTSKQLDPALYENIRLYTVSKAPEVEMNGQMLDKTGIGLKSMFFYETYNAESSDVDVHACYVEDFALFKYKEQGYSNGVHAEGSILISLFGLLFWDVIYMPGIPDAFRSPHQAFPLDLNSESFFVNRKVDIERRFDFLNLSPIEDVTALVDKHWKENEGSASIVSWNLITCDMAMSLVTCIGNSCLSKICHRLVGNFKHFRSGVPDLTVWNSATNMWKMVEVKGPGDRLSNKQIVWLNFLMGIGVPVEVCYVHAFGGKKIPTSADVPKLEV